MFCPLRSGLKQYKSLSKYQLKLLFCKEAYLIISFKVHGFCYLVLLWLLYVLLTFPLVCNHFLIFAARRIKLIVVIILILHLVINFNLQSLWWPNFSVDLKTVNISFGNIKE